MEFVKLKTGWEFIKRNWVAEVVGLLLFFVGMGVGLAVKKPQKIVSSTQATNISSTGIPKPTIVQDPKTALKFGCDNENAAYYSKDKEYKVCKVKNEYEVGRLIGYDNKKDYFRFLEPLGRLKSGTREYLGYADYPGIFEEAQFYGRDLETIYSRIFEIDAENKSVRVIADPWMIPNLKDWFMKKTPQFWVRNESYSLSPNNRYLMVEATSCTGCSTVGDWYVVDTETLKMTHLGIIAGDIKSVAKWVNSNTLEWNKGQLNSELEIINLGKQITSF
jgi:hypothetical protein